MDLTGVKFTLHIILENVALLDHSPAYSSGKCSVIPLTFHECLCQNARQTSFGPSGVHGLEWEMHESAGHNRGVHREGTRDTEVKILPGEGVSVCVCEGGGERERDYEYEWV